jgi:hypothetical protein
MVTDHQVRRLQHLDLKGIPKGRAAAQAGMDDKTARKYRRLGWLPSEVRLEHHWRTKRDPFADVWPQLEALLAVNPGLEAKTLLEHLQRQYPGRFADGQVRTLQRRVKQWRALCGPAKEVFFSQVHEPGRLCASDCTHCGELGVTIAHEPFPHLIYHFVLTYSNWETGTLCFAESLESLSEGLQNGLWQLGGAPQVHRTDRLTAAVPPGAAAQVFQRHYQGLLEHYGLKGQAIRAGKANENGDAAVVRPAQRRATTAAGRGSDAAAATAGAAAGGVPTAARQGGHGQHDPGGGQRLLGRQPADRGVGRGAAVRRARGGVVRAAACGADAAAARAGAAPGRVPSRDRLAGAQAGGVRRLLLPGGPVPQ